MTDRQRGCWTNSHLKRQRKSVKKKTQQKMPSSAYV